MFIPITCVFNCHDPISIIPDDDANPETEDDDVLTGDGQILTPREM
jgi:hypothetical protein